MFVVLFVGHSYLINRDLSIAVIEKYMVSRQQSQLKDYFLNSLDAVLIAVENKSLDEK
jgi:hypothetical protein